MTVKGGAVVSDRLEEWRRRLIDLSYRNRLIKYRKTRASTLELEAPTFDVLLADPARAQPWRFYFPPEPEEGDQVDPQESAAAAYVDDIVLESVVHPNHPPAADEIVARGIDARQLNRTLDNLAKKAKAEFQDKALRILYIAAGFLDWFDVARQERLLSPLILVPVELRRETARHPYKLYFVDDEEIVINPSLTEKLRRDVGHEIPLDWAWEDKPLATELDEIEAAIGDTDWTVRRDAVIGLFSFQKYVMFRDLLDNEAAILPHPAIQSLAAKKLVDELDPEAAELPRLDELDDVQPPPNDLAILDADATQRLCIEAARRGQSFVMQGPPGTGKSQTIANIMSNAIGDGKRVLFVSEKAAALDVVHRRLAAEGLDEFCLMLHGEHAARREVVEALHHSLSSEPVARRGLTSNELERLKTLRELLNSTAQLIHLPMTTLADRSMYDVLGELSELHRAPPITASPEASSASGADVRNEFHRIDEIFQRLADRWRVSPRAFVWSDYASSRFSADDRARVLAVVQRTGDSAAAIEAAAGDVARLLGWPAPINLRSVEQLLLLGEHLARAPSLDDRWLEAGFATKLKDSAVAASSALDELATATREFETEYPSRPIDDYKSSALRDLEQALTDLGRLAGETGAWRRELVRSTPSVAAFLVRADDLLARVAEAAASTARLLGQPDDKLTLERAAELADLADLAFSEHDRPDATWLVRAGAERAQTALTQFGAKIQRYQHERAQLFASYAEPVLGLEAARLHERFATEYKSILARMKSSYRADARAIKAVRRDGKLGENVVDDLAAIASLQALGAEIRGEKHRLERAFGGYFNEVETDVAAVGRGVAAAARVIELSDARADLETLAARVGAGSEPDIRAGQLSDQIRDALSALERGLRELRPLVGRASTLFGPQLPVSLIRENLRQLGPCFKRLDDLIEELGGGSSEPPTTLESALARARTITTLHEVRKEVADQQTTWAAVLGSAYRGAATDFGAVVLAADWLEQLAQLTGGAIPDRMRGLLIHQEPRWPEFDQVVAARDGYMRATEELASLFEHDRSASVLDTSRAGSFRDVVQLCAELTRCIDDLYDWAEFRTSRDRAREEGWGDFLGALIEHDAEAEMVTPAFRKAYWSRRLEALFEEDPDLADRGATYARWIAEFQDLDRRLVKSASDRVVAARSRQRTTHVSVEGSEVALLRREASKKKRHMPVRKLLAAIPRLLSELKPCLMMSPLTVSHFLSPEHQFDLVVFDEASQVPPQDAINCVYRGRQLIVAGDSRQLPPTPFFQVTDPDEPWDEADETAEDMESILDSCEALLPRHPLRWHYRSRHEDLIAFSNAMVYDRSLLTFPSADQFSAAKGVRFIHVPDGVYDRGRTSANRREAQVVAERVVEHLLESERSVGVITFSSTQRDAVSEELDRLRIEFPEIEHRFSGDRLDEVFVKHLESVQGDERDVIVFSVGYGRDTEGKFTMNFGPLNKDGGYRRLNVAVTRGRELVEVVSSVRAADFTLSESASRGAKLLRDYIRFAETNGTSIVGAEQEERDYVSPLEATIGAAVAELGYEVVPQVGAGTYRVDLGIRDPANEEGYVLAVTTDGLSYSSTPTARDRDRLRETVLRNLHWKVHRVWSLDWVRNREAELERLRAALASAGEEEDETLDQDVEPVQRERNERAVAELRDAYDAENLPWVVEYSRVELPKQRADYDFHVSINRARQRDLVVDLVCGEGPVHVDYVIRRLAGAWGLKRTSDRIRKAGMQAIRMAARSGDVELRGKFVWPPAHDLDAVRSPCWNDDRTWRNIHEIPREEIDLAITKLVAASGGAVGEHLVSDVGRVLGYFRIGGQIREVLTKRIRAVAKEINGATR